MTIPNGDKADLKRLGGLLALYRRGFGGNMSRGALLEALSKDGDPLYANLDESSLRRWENGERRPPRGFLADFAGALRLSRPETDALMALAGYAPPEPDTEAAELLALAHGVYAQAQRARPQSETATAADSPTRAERRAAMDAGTLAKETFRRAAGPGIYASAVAYGLNAMGLDGAVVQASYSAAALAIVGGQGVLRWRRADATSELFFISLFFVLNASLLMFSITRMDHFGFFALVPWGGEWTFLLLTFFAHLALALAASLAFDALRIRMYSVNGPRSAFARAMWTALPPCLFVFGNMLVFVNEGGWFFHLVALGVTFGAFTAILAFQDDAVTLSEWEAKMSLIAAVAVIAALCLVGSAGGIVAYLSPSPLAFPDHNLFMEWEVDYARIGYPPEETLERYRLGLALMATAVIAYIATALGGYLVSATYRHVARHHGGDGDGGGL